MIGTISKPLRRFVNLHGGICHICLRPVDCTVSPIDPRFPSKDHIVPRVVVGKGANNEGNYALAHRACNSFRGDRPVDELEPDVYWRHLCAQVNRFQ